MSLNDYIDDYEKRASAMGFQGMRGKKDEYENFEWEKRAPMGFQGMRGKKALLHELQELQKKAIMGFQVLTPLKKFTYSLNATFTYIFIFILIFPAL